MFLRQLGFQYLDLLQYPRFKRDINVYIRSGAGREVLAWKLDLVNYPLQLFVAPGGGTVVTMDAWGSVGSDALIFYGNHGKVIKRYEKAEGVLITPDENKWVERSISSFWWSKGTHAQFTADGQYFWVWLPWGRMMVFDVTTGDAIDSEALRLQIGRGRATILKTAQLMSESSIPLERIATARLAGWLNGQAVLPILRKLLLDPYYENDSLQTRAEDKFGRFGDAWFWLSQRRYPVRRAAAEELHIKFGGSADGAVEETIGR